MDIPANEFGARMKGFMLGYSKGIDRVALAALENTIGVMRQRIFSDSGSRNVSGGSLGKHGGMYASSKYGQSKNRLHNRITLQNTQQLFNSIDTGFTSKKRAAIGFVELNRDDGLQNDELAEYIEATYGVDIFAISRDELNLFNNQFNNFEQKLVNRLERKWF